MSTEQQTPPGPLESDDAPSADALAKAKMDYHITSLRLTGMSVYEIAELTGLSAMQVCRRLDKSLRRWNRLEQQEAETLCRLEVARLDEMLKSLWPQITGKKPDGTPYHYKNEGGSRIKAIEMALRIGERRAKLLGLDAPEKTRLEVDVAIEGMSPAELMHEAEKLGLPVFTLDEMAQLTGGPLPGLLIQQPKQVQGLDVTPGKEEHELPPGSDHSGI